MNRRALHYVIRVADRRAAYDFYVGKLRMKVLRHEEFAEGCEATCNGPYAGRWSKTMVGFGPEDDHFVLELTYNYGIHSYELGSHFHAFELCSKDLYRRLRESSPATVEDDHVTVNDPNGYRVFIRDEAREDPFSKVVLHCSDLKKSLDFWHGVLNMNVSELNDESPTSAVLSYGDKQCRLELRLGAVDRGSGFGRIAFACATSELKDIQQLIEQKGYTVLTPYIQLRTTGKATVAVVVLADPDGHEICFVGDEAFRQLSAVDPDGEKLLLKSIEEDKS